jgi:hypothetical protein
MAERGADGQVLQHEEITHTGQPGCVMAPPLLMVTIVFALHFPCQKAAGLNDFDTNIHPEQMYSIHYN